MAWLSAGMSLLAALLVVFVPGAAVACALGLRRLAALAFAPLATTAIVTVVAVVYGLVRVPWTLWTAALGMIVVIALVFVWGRVFRVDRADSASTGARWPLPAALAVAAVLVTIRFTAYIGVPENIAQFNDAPFHLGVVRAMIEQRTATPFGLIALIDPAAGGSFYPGAWHAVASIVVLATGASIPVVTNALSIVVGAIVWPLGVAWLAEVLTRRRLAAAAAAAIAPMFVIFPLEMIQYGPLYPYLLAVAILPAAIAGVIVLAPARRVEEAAPSRSTWSRYAAMVLAAAMSAAALANAQASVLLVWALVLWLWAAGGAVLRWRRGGPHRLRAPVLAAASLALLAVVWWRFARLVNAGIWAPPLGAREALVEALSMGYAGTAAMWGVSVLVGIGAVVLVRRSGVRWAVAGWFAFVVLAFIAAAVNTKLIRHLAVGPWYSDPYRLAALVPVLAIPLAAVGVVTLADAAARLASRGDTARAARSGRVWGPVAIAVVLAASTIVVASQPLVLRYRIGDGKVEAESPFVVSDHSWLSIDEWALLDRLADHVEPGVRVLGNPGTGAAFGYALTGVDVFPRQWWVPTDPAYTLLKMRLHEAATDPAVCEAVHDLDARYVLDFGIGDTGPGRVEPMPGFTGFEGTPGFELVDREGEASLWRITACG